jgi:putative cell wall-binding protein
MQVGFSAILTALAAEADRGGVVAWLTQPPVLVALLVAGVGALLYGADRLDNSSSWGAVRDGRGARVALAAVAVLVLAGGAAAWWRTSDGATTRLVEGASSQEAQSADAMGDEVGGDPGGPVAPPGPASAPAVSAFDAVGQAVAASQQAYPDGQAENVLLARAAPSAEALAAAGLQGLFDSPLLLTDSVVLSPETAAEIDRLGTPSIHILGGDRAVAPAIEEQLAATGHATHRHAGPTGVETAISIAELHFPDATTAILTRAYDSSADATDAFADSLAAGGLAAAQQLPVLLTGAGGLSQTTSAYLERSLVRSVVVVGDVTAIGGQVVTDLADLGIESSRVAGPDRYGTAAAIAQLPQFTDASAVVLVEGSRASVWPGGSLAAVIAGREDAPILLTDSDELPEATAAYLEARRFVPTRLVCGPGVTATACAAAEAIAVTT